jgi:hypothetical protein
MALDYEMIDEEGDGNTGRVGEEVGPEKAVAEHEGGGFEGANLVDPGGVIELGKFNEEGEGEAESGDFERGEPREAESEEAVDEGGPGGVAGVGNIPVRQGAGGEEAGGEADGKEEDEEEGEWEARGGRHGREQGILIRRTFPAWPCGWPLAICLGPLGSEC